jgi:hypothetical protein
MRRISVNALYRTRCLRKADEIVDRTARYIRSGGYTDLRRGDFSHLQDAFTRLERLRNTHLSMREYEKCIREIRAAVEEVCTPQKQCLRESAINCLALPEAEAVKRRWGLGPVNRPRMSPR